MVAFSFVAVQVFDFFSAACSHSFEDTEPSADSPYQNHGADVDIDKQVSSCAGYDPQVYGYKRPSSGGGGGGSEPKKHRADDQGDDGNHNNAPPGDTGGGGNGHDGHGPGDNGGGSGENDDPQNSGNRPREKRLACPFHKLDPERFRDCESIKLTTWDRVLQHISRAHVLRKHYCPRCRTQFKGDEAETEKNEHIRNQCQLGDMMETGYIFLKNAPDKLHLETDYEHLKGLPRGSDEDKWFAGYKKLFPGVTKPQSALFESVIDILRRNASSVLDEIPEPDRSRFYKAIFNLPTVASQRSSRDLAPPAPTPAGASNSAAMPPAPVMTPLAPASSPARIAAPNRAPDPAEVSISAPPSRRSAINSPTMRRRQAQARMSPYGSTPIAGRAINMATQVQRNPQVGRGRPSRARAMNAPASPHPPSLPVGYSPPPGSNLPNDQAIKTQALPKLPDEVLMGSPFGLYPQSPLGQQTPLGQQNPLGQQSPLGQQNFLGQLSNLDPRLWSDPQAMFDPMWNLGDENIFANTEMGTSPLVNENDDEDEFNPSSGFGNGSGYQGPGSGYRG